MTETSYLCIGCPLGCRLEVTETGDENVQVRGFSCKRGKAFALQEHSDPRRMVATTVTAKGGALARLPVRVSEPVRKPDVIRVCAALRGLTVVAPLRAGQVVASNILGTGVNVIATRDLPAA